MIDSVYLNANTFTMAIMDIPENFRSQSVLYSQHFAMLEHPLASVVQHLLYVSDFAVRQINHLKILLAEDNCELALSALDYYRLVAALSLDLPARVFSSALRHFRHTHLLRLMLRELGELASTEETMASWSDCADSLILHALQYVEQQLMLRFGKPYSETGEPVTLYILAMGKLGGRELNFSSDIDLILAYSAAGHTQGKESISNQEYFTKVVQQWVQLLQTITAEGFVFRVDLRLRPNGDSGPLVSTYAAMETYYQEQGRDWERYAMVKARPIDRSADLPHWFHRLIIPFAYRKYVDFGVIESLRSMKGMIEREIQLNPMLDDIKRGRGGIRELEFVIQSFQLIRGGRMPEIQHQNAMKALAALKKTKLLTRTVVLQKAYLFLRKLENAIQMQNDQQIHDLPGDGLRQQQLVLAMAYASWEDLLEKLHQYQRIIARAFQAVLSQPDDYQDEKRLLAHQLASLWQGHLEPTMAVNLLISLQFQKPDRCYQMIYAFRNSPRCRRLSQAARMRLDRFMVLLLSELSEIKATDEVLLSVLSLLENIVGRSAYLALLTENPPALHELLYWFVHSPYISALLVSQPFLLEVLVDQAYWQPLSRRQLRKLLKTRLSHCTEDEAEDDLLRQFKLTCWLQAARAELYDQHSAVRIGQFLADVTEVIIARVLTRACQQLSFRYPEITQVKAHFAIIAYGKLGSREMNYDSDVDLVFLHAVKPADEALVTRLTQKILHMLTMRTQAGILYAVDTRLRPSGSAGLLVSHLDAFIDYQQKNAWTWEHQAILRARVLFANRGMQKAFYQLKKDILLVVRDKQTLRNEVQAMREKIGKPLGDHPIKYIPGGLLDLEFLIQFLVLAYPDERFFQCTNTCLQLRKLTIMQRVSSNQFKILKRAYRYYHKELHQSLLRSLATDADKSSVGGGRILQIIESLQNLHVNHNHRCQ